jgi:predicted HicB family RNase H-like nuclease
MGGDVEAKAARSGEAIEDNVRPIQAASKSKSRDKRAWTIKGIASETVAQSRLAAQTQGMLLSLWVDKQLRDAAARELDGGAVKSFAAEFMCTKIESIEASLKEYLEQQDRRIAELQKEVRMLTHEIVPPLIKALSDERPRKTA